MKMPISAWQHWWHRRSLRSQLILAIAVIGLLALLLNGGVICVFLGGPLYQGDPAVVPRWDRAIVLVILSTALAVALVLLGSVLAARALARPLHVLTHLAQEIAAGDSTRRMTPMGPAEMQLLSRTFNRMLEEVLRQRQVEHDLLLNVSHELAAPLSLIRGYAEALSDGMFDDEIQRHAALHAMSAEATRLARLSGDLLDMALMETGQSHPQVEAVPMSAFLTGLAQRFTPQATLRGIRLDLQLAPNLPLLLTDGLRLEQVFVNLLTNALRHTPAGGTITLRARHEGMGLRLEVADTGPGIPRVLVDRIWEPFYQVEAGRDQREDTAGVGLGLTICRATMTWLGGHIGVESPPGCGATFFLWLPHAQDREQRAVGESTGFLPATRSLVCHTPLSSSWYRSPDELASCAEWQAREKED